MSEQYSIGAAHDCDVVVNQPQVSGHHARLLRESDGWYIEDTKSTNHVFIHGRQVQRALVMPGDVVALGSHEVLVSDLIAWGSRGRPAQVNARPDRPQPAVPASVTTVTVKDRIVTIGRDRLAGDGPAAKNHVEVPDSMVTGRHARVYRNAGRLILEDIGSRNGTFVRKAGTDDWVSYRDYVLREGDAVRIGSRVFRFTSERPVDSGGARLDVREVEFEVTNRATGQPLNLLHGISFSVLEGEVTGIMGPAGSGKTTLLNILAGFDKPTKGDVRAQGKQILEGGELGQGMGAVIGHAPQFDVSHELLAVREAVAYSAKLRGPASWSDADIATRTKQALTDVDAWELRDKPIGSETNKTLSGGQKKRVNIAMELVLDPQILLLDEPTSGLSAQDTMDLMHLLRRLADTGRTIVLTIHQPSYAAFIQMDQILILEAGGHVAWFGPAAIDSFKYFDVTDRDPAALLETLGLDKRDSLQAPGAYAIKYATHPMRTAKVVDRARMLDVMEMAPLVPVVQPGPLAQLGTLLVRNLLIKRKDLFFLLLTTAVPGLVALIFALVLGSQITKKDAAEWGTARADLEHQYLVVLTIMSCLFGALCSSLEIVMEVPILRRERRGGLSLLAYVASKAVTFALPAAVFPAVALAALILATGKVLEGDFLTYWAVLAPTFFAATCAGLFLSSVSKSQQGVIVMSVFYAILQVVFSVFAPLHVTFEQQKTGAGDEREVAREGWLGVVSKPMTARWALAGLATTSDLCQDDRGGKGDSTADEPCDTQPSTTSADAVRDWRWRCDVCRPKYYRDHGIRDAEFTGDRTSKKAYRQSIVMNLFLALVAMVGTGAVLRGRGQKTQ